jgi:hypothetical protein
LEWVEAAPGFDQFLLRLGENRITHILYNPTGLERMGGMSPVYRLSPKTLERLHAYLGALPTVYRDQRYIIFRVEAPPR